MQTFTAFDYLCIDIANQWGIDNQLFGDRITWVKENITRLEELGDSREGKWKERPLYKKAVISLRKVQRGLPTGHMVHFDAICSGMQIMSALTGCYAGANATGLVDPDRRADAYTDCMKLMQQRIPSMPSSDRKSVKDAVMTSLYGSVRQPEKLFGEDTPELSAFHESLLELAPGACDLLRVLRNSWNSFALKHSWVLPDNHHVHVKVMQSIDARIEVDELNHSTFTYRYEENEGSQTGLSNIANVVHSIDAYLLRSLIRRCNYDPVVADNAIKCCEAELLERDMMGITTTYAEQYPVGIKTMYDRYEATKMVDVTDIGEIDNWTVAYLSSTHLKELVRVLSDMLTEEPFEVVTVHDSFACAPTNMNQLRYHYKEIMADMADAEILNDILGDLYDMPINITKLSSNLSTYIRQSNYSLS